MADALVVARDLAFAVTGLGIATIAYWRFRFWVTRLLLLLAALALVVARLGFAPDRPEAAATEALFFFFFTLAIATHFLRELQQNELHLAGSRERERLFAGVLAHDVQNRFGALLPKIELLRTRRPEVAPDLDELEDSLRRTLQATENTLAMHTLTEASGGGLAEVPLAQVVGEAIREVQPQAEARNVNVRVVNGHAVRVKDGGLVELAVRTLLENAVEWAPPGSPVEIVVEAGRRRFRLKVADHGPGVSPDDQTKLFVDRFSRRPGGHGLGLSIVHRVAQLQGAHVRYEDTPGGGATFVLEWDRPRGANGTPTHDAHGPS